MRRASRSQEPAATLRGWFDLVACPGLTAYRALVPPSPLLGLRRAAVSMPARPPTAAAPMVPRRASASGREDSATAGAVTTTGVAGGGDLVPELPPPLAGGEGVGVTAVALGSLTCASGLGRLRTIPATQITATTPRATTARAFAKSFTKSFARFLTGQPNHSTSDKVKPLARQWPKPMT